MKKTLTFLTLSAVAMTAMPIQPVQFSRDLPATRENLETGIFAGIPDTRSTETTLPSDMWGYNCGIYDFQGLGEPVEDFRMATGYDATTATLLAGKKVTSIGVSSPILLSMEPLEATMFITQDLNGEPLAEVPFTTNGCPLENGYPTALTYDIVSLPEAVTIEAGKPFYVGYKVAHLRADDFVLAYDGMPFAGEGFLISASATGNEWLNFSEFYGAACFYIGLDEMPTDMIRTLNAQFSKQISKGDPIESQFVVLNIGGNQVESAGVEIRLGSSDPVILEATPDNGGLLVPGLAGVEPGVIDSRSAAYVMVSGLTDVPTGISTMTARIAKVNGNDNGWTPTEYTSKVLVLNGSDGYKRNVVVEEGTGTWCGFCVRGYVGMDYMMSQYTDGSYIGIAVHSSDPMQCDAYDEMAQKYFDSYPTAVVNRIDVVDPSSQNLETAYFESLEMPTYGKISIDDIEITSDNTISIKTTSEVCLAGNYAVAFVLKENGVGPYTQTNYYSGGAYGAMDGFEDLPNKVDLEFDEVARSIHDAFGIEGSLPTDMATGTPYEFSYDIPLHYGEDENHNPLIADVAKSAVVALLIDSDMGFIVNAEQIELANVGVDTISDNASIKITAGKGIISYEGPYSAIVYDAGGRACGSLNPSETISLAKGLYLVNADGRTIKVMVR